MTRDITFCANECKKRGCHRHNCNAEGMDGNFSYTLFLGTPLCPCFSEMIDIKVVSDCTSWWSMRINLKEMAEIAGKKLKDDEGEFYTDWSLKQARKMCRLIAEHGGAWQHEMCNAWFSTNEKLMKVWVEEYAKRK